MGPFKTGIAFIVGCHSWQWSVTGGCSHWQLVMYQLFCHNSKGPEANFELKQLKDKEIESHKNNNKYQKPSSFSNQ